MSMTLTMVSLGSWDEWWPTPESGIARLVRWAAGWPRTILRVLTVRAEVEALRSSR
jgi:hypothetical protein